MIPYEDLVAALAAWRARAGLPVAQPTVPAPPAPPPRVAAPAPAVTRATAPRAAPPPPPPAPPAPAPSSSNDDFEDEAGLVEDGQYASAGDDYVVPLGGDMVEVGESTAIGDAPEPPSAGLTKRGKRNHDW